MSLKSLFQMGANTQVHILSFQTIKSRTGRVSLNFSMVTSMREISGMVKYMAKVIIKVQMEHDISAVL